MNNTVQKSINISLLCLSLGLVPNGRLQCGELIASKTPDANLQSSYIVQSKYGLSKANQKILKAITNIEIKSSLKNVINALTDFNNYPKIFPNIQSHKIIKQEDNFVLTERFLKPMFIYKQTKHNVIYNLSNCPSELTWVIPANNNVSYASGKWVVESVSPQVTRVTYSIKVIPQKSVPPGFGNMVLNFIQNDAVKSLKKYCEAS